MNIIKNIFILLRYDWQNGLGDWTQMKNDTFDFKVFSGNAPTWYTGPRNDHTYGEVHGKSVIRSIENLSAFEAINYESIDDLSR